MSVLYDLDESADWLDGDAAAECFYCGGGVVAPCIVWHGSLLLFLHAACARSLATHLIGDSREAQLAADPEPHWRRRGIAVVRYRLQAEEERVA